MHKKYPEPNENWRDGSEKIEIRKHDTKQHRAKLFWHRKMSNFSFQLFRKPEPIRRSVVNCKEFFLLHNRNQSHFILTWQRMPLSTAEHQHEIRLRDGWKRARRTRRRNSHASIVTNKIGNERNAVEVNLPVVELRSSMCAWVAWWI
jgi:hypothetical protein